MRKRHLPGLWLVAILLSSLVPGLRPAQAPTWKAGTVEDRITTCVERLVADVP